MSELHVSKYLIKQHTAYQSHNFSRLFQRIYGCLVDDIDGRYSIHGYNDVIRSAESQQQICLISLYAICISCQLARKRSVKCHVR